MPIPTWSGILDLAASFASSLQAAKTRLAGDCSWYPYETLSNLTKLTPVFAASAASFEELAGAGPILDIGAGDGDLSFLLAQAGYTVHALDNPATNFNGMQGIRLLARELGSNVTILGANLDRDFELEPYQLVLCLGVLYHLKSPLQVLEAIARSAQYCVLSTRVARQSPEGLRLDPQPLAYLLDDSELNQDNSNYWIFTPAGLRRLARRAGWSTLHVSYYGDTRTSNPLSLAEHDERAYVLLKSRKALANVELLSGWHPAEERGWRWTQREFSALATVTAEPGSTFQLQVQFFLSGDVIRVMGPITLRCRADGRPLEPMLYPEPGDMVYRAILPALPSGAPVLLQFSLDKAIPPSEMDARELGIIVQSIDVSAV
ncbi:class I SAM-dependent methyltransferase [Paludibaculum fermentans]|uniref:Class I SAM-dependent methyltransferase n=1 Tax=Paludibaculum fermentans TaxID=1473598 RepID=A0A7S7NLL5_PALFE|nr:class I SAM-dependent methyltransferase [Paludibaculum fermentans]QOY85394.1 class I SAM-dependent methyltransferase [Paludibaculum fermentans]